MDIRLDGETRVYYVVGDPIAQVKSPTGMTTAFQQNGLNAVCIPAHVAAEDLSDFFSALKSMRNVDGLMVTVPHKIAFSAVLLKGQIGFVFHRIKNLDGKIFLR